MASRGGGVLAHAGTTCSTLLLAEQPVSGPNATKIGKKICVTISPSKNVDEGSYSRLCVGYFCCRARYSLGILIPLGPPVASLRSSRKWSSEFRRRRWPSQGERISDRIRFDGRAATANHFF